MKILIYLSICTFPCWLLSQQIPDTTFNPVIQNPEYKAGKGSLVFIDEGHNNFHTKDGRYLPFARLLKKDGYTVTGYKGEFTKEKLSKGKILVIANALNEVNIDNWILPNPSAFTDAEILVLKDWVGSGGSLFLIADHMPWPGAAEKLAAVFGFKFFNGFNFDVINPSYFRSSDNTIIENIITTGRDSFETVRQIPNTEGQAFQIPQDANPILVFNNTSMLLLPDTAWEFHSNTRMIKIEGWCQGAFKKFGKGRIAVFGEASMFTAQIGDPGRRKMGMNRSDASDNYKLLLNTIHWLDGKIN
jgi:hypothetical protein